MDSQSKTNSYSMPEEKIAALEEKQRILQEQTSTLRRVIEEQEGARNRAEAEAAKFRLLFENAIDGILVADCETHRFILANRRICQMLGYTQEELLGRTIEDIHPPEVIPQALELFGSVLREELDHLIDYPLLRKDGGTFHADITAGLLRIESKPAAIGFFRDVEERSKAREQLWQREAELSSIFRAAPIGIGVLINRVFIKANRRLCEMVGYAEEEIIDRNARFLYLTQEDYDYVGREKYNQIREKGTGTVETRWRTKDGRILDVLLSSTPLDVNDWNKGVTFTALDITDRKEAEHELARSNSFLRTVIDKAPFGIQVAEECSGRWRLAMINQEAQRMTGVPEEEQRNISLQDGQLLDPKNRMWKMFYPDRTPWPLNEVPLAQAVLEGKTIRNEEMILQRSDGAEFTILCNAAPIRDEQGTILGGVVIFPDISDRKEAENQLAHQQRELIAVFHSAPVGISQVKNRVFQQVNQIFCQSLGYTIEELIGKQTSILYPSEEDFHLWGEYLYSKLHEQGEVTQEITFRHKDGQLVDFLLRGVHADPQDPDKGQLFAFTDITDRKRAQTALAESEQRFRQMFERMSSAVAIYRAVDDGQDFVLADLNPSVERIEKCRKEEVLGRRITEVFPGVESFGLLDVLRRVYRTGQPAYHPVSLYRDDRIWGWRENYVYKLPGGEVVALYDDVTERKQAEQAKEKLLKELRAKNEELESIVFIASHDLRSPLVNIEGFTGEVSKSCRELIKLVGPIPCSKEIRQQIDYLLEKDVPESIRFISAGTAKMDALLSGLLRLSRIGTATIHIGPVQMNLLIQTVLGAMRFEIQRLGAEIQTQDLPNCLGDAVQINQVFSNLIDNAIKYRHPDRPIQIRITGTAQGDEAVYAVTDNGIGIDPQHHEKIFEIFHQLNPGGTQGGQGLGLTIVRRILDRLDGRIRVESELGAGSNFIITLPRVR